MPPNTPAQRLRAPTLTFSAVCPDPRALHGDHHRQGKRREDEIRAQQAQMRQRQARESPRDRADIINPPYLIPAEQGDQQRGHHERDQ
jgi:hypothetical protein